MGYIIYRTAGNSARVRNWPQIVAYLFGANAPDLDFVPGLVVGDLGRFHQGYLIALLLQCCLPLLPVLFFSRPLRSDLVLPLTCPARLPCPGSESTLGVPLFWPLSDKYYMAPLLSFRALTARIPWQQQAYRLFSFS